MSARARYLTRPALVIALWLGPWLTPGITRAGVMFVTNPVQTSTNLGDFTRVYDGSNNPVMNQVYALNLNNNGSLGQNQPIAKITTFGDTAGTQPVNVYIQSPQGGGQSDLYSTSPIGSGTVTAVNPPLLGFSTIQFNPYFDFLGKKVTASFWFTVTTNLGVYSNASTPWTVDSNGQFRVASVVTGSTASDPEYITKLQFFVNPPSADTLKQFRVDAVLDPPSVSAAPEPPVFACACTVTLFVLGVAWRYRPVEVA